MLRSFNSLLLQQRVQPGSSEAYVFATLCIFCGKSSTLGTVRNPSGPNTASVVSQVSASVAVTSSLTQPLNNQAWNYIYAMRTGTSGGCDQSFANNVIVKAPMYVDGNLCLRNNAGIEKASAPPSPEPMVNLAVQGTVGSRTMRTSA